MAREPKKKEEEPKQPNVPVPSQRTHGKYFGGGAAGARTGTIKTRKSGYKGSRAKKGSRSSGRQVPGGK